MSRQKEIMKEVEEIKKLLDSISQRLEHISNQERKFDLDICIHLEHMSWETHRMSNNLKELQAMGGF